MGDYKIDGNIIPRPTSGRWVARRPIDVQGDNRPLYAPVRTFELRWNIRYWEDWAVLVVAFENLQTTGTIVAEIPAYPTATGVAFGFQEYSGCTMGEPVIGPFFGEEYPTNVALIIGNIRTQ